MRGKHNFKHYYDYYKRVQSGFYLLNEAQCSMICYPVEEGEKPKGKVENQLLYDRTGKVKIFCDYLIPEGMISGKELMDLINFHPDVKTKNYILNNEGLSPLFDINEISQILGTKILTDEEIKVLKPYHWTEYELLNLKIPIKNFEPVGIIVGGRKKKRGFIYDCREILASINKMYISFEDFEIKSDFRNLTNNIMKDFPLKWNLNKAGLKLLGYLENQEEFFYLEDEAVEGSPFGKIIKDEDIEEDDIVIEIKEFKNFKKTINRNKKPINSVIFKGLTEDYKGIFNINKQPRKQYRKGNRVEKSVTEKPIIYLLLNAGVVVYVGQTIGEVKRLQTHKREKIFDEYKTIECRKEELDELEAYYVVKYKPIYNLKLPKNKRYMRIEVISWKLNIPIEKVGQLIRKKGINVAFVEGTKTENREYFLYDKEDFGIDDEKEVGILIEEGITIKEYIHYLTLKHFHVFSLSYNEIGRITKIRSKSRVENSINLYPQLPYEFRKTLKIIEQILSGKYEGEESVLFKWFPIVEESLKIKLEVRSINRKKQLILFSNNQKNTIGEYYKPTLPSRNNYEKMKKLILGKARKEYRELQFPRSISPKDSESGEIYLENKDDDNTIYNKDFLLNSEEMKAILKSKNFNDVNFETKERFQEDSIEERMNNSFSMKLKINNGKISCEDKALERTLNEILNRKVEKYILFLKKMKNEIEEIENKT